MAVVPERPLLKPWYRVADGDGRLVLEYEHRAVVLEGRALERLVPALLPLLDGERSIDEIVDELGPAAEVAVRGALTVLAERGLLTGGPPLGTDEPTGARASATFLAASRGGSPGEALARVREAHVAVVGGSDVARRVARLVRETGVGTVSPSGYDSAVEGADVAIVAPSGDELPRLARWNDVALAAGLAWLQALPFDGRFVAVGPLVVPGETACGRCYSLRRASCLGYGDDFDRVESAGGERPSPPPLSAAVAGLAVAVALRWVAGDRAPAGPVRAFEWAPTLSLSAHRVYRVPRCPACSSAHDTAPLLPWFKEAA